MPQRDKEQGIRGKGDRRHMRKGQGYLPQRDKGLPLDREETDLAYRRTAVCKGVRENLHVRLSYLIGHVN